MTPHPSTYNIDEFLEGDNPRLLVDHGGDLTAGQKERYLRAAVFCPHCESGDIEGSSIEFYVSGASQIVSCLACGRRWMNIYTLTDVELIEE